MIRHAEKYRRYYQKVGKIPRIFFWSFSVIALASGWLVLYD